MDNSYDLAEFGIDLAQQKGAKYVEARFINGQKTGFFLRNDNVISGSKTPWEGIGFRVLYNGGIGFTSVEQLTKENVKTAVKTAIKMAEVSNPREKIDLGEPVSNKASWKVDYNEDINDIHPLCRKWMEKQKITTSKIEPISSKPTSLRRFY
ncbi:MAG: PmbA/TldA family metallopeptidase [Candidatus Hodarchaeales archaeon]